jgi:hypothetical protein
MLLPLSAAAQAETRPYDWIEADLGLVYPAEWEPPVSTTTPDGRLALMMAQTLANQPDIRPLNTPTITLILIDNTEPTTDPAAFAEIYLTNQATPPTTSPIEVRFAGLTGFTLSGASADGTLFGIARASRADDGRVYVLVGRTPVEGRNDFLRRYDAVAASISPLTDVSPVAPVYGVLWATIMTAAEGDTALLNPRALAYEVGTGLIAVDADLGLLRIDSQTGDWTTLVNTPLIADVTDAAVSSSGSIYLADPACPCVRIFDASGIVQGELEGFAEGAPLSVAVAPDGAVYATDVTETGFAVRVFRGESVEVIALDPAVDAQPELLIEAFGRLLALASGGDAFVLDGGAFNLLLTLPAPPAFINDAAVVGNRFVFAAGSEGVLLYDTVGEVGAVGLLVNDTPLPGEVVTPVAVAVGADETIYIADGNGAFGAITAMSANADPNRLGAQSLVLETTVQGLVSDDAPQQAWTYSGTAGERLTISAVDASGADQIDPALRLIAPDGAELAYNNDQELADLFSPFDAQIVDVALPIDGTYTILVENGGGNGVYLLGVNRTEPFDLAAGTVEASLGEALPTDRWLFEASAGSVYTFTMSATSGDLDPLLRVYAPDGTLLAENDDAEDATLGTDAQIVGLALPADGVYRLEASRFAGTGDYILTVTP